MYYSKTTNLVLCALFAALIGVSAGIVIPLPFTPVPLTIANLAVMLTGGLLGSKYGSVSVTVYVLLGAFGLPVFAGYTGGFDKILGPTGGYIIGYILTALVVGIIIECANKNKYKSKGNGKSNENVNNNSFIVNILAMAAGTAACYLLGTLWFMFSTSTPLWASLISCVFPFLIGDVIKIAVGALLIKKLRPALHR